MKSFFVGIGTFFVLVLSGFGIYSVHSYTWPIIEGHFYEMGKNPGYIPTGDRIRPLVLGFDHFAANLFWIRAAQYAGGNSGNFEFDSLPEYIDLVTDLDPHFAFAYRFGALVFPLNKVAIEKVDELLLKGIEKNQSYPELLPQMYIDLAFYTYYYMDDLEKGAEIYEECAASIPGCPPFAEKVAAFLRAKTGKHDITLRIWIDRFLEKKEKSEEEVDLEIKKIEESAKLVALTCAANNYMSYTGRGLSSLEELKGQNIFPCSGLSTLSKNQQSVLIELSRQRGFELKQISDEILSSPFDHNPFEWDSENKKVTARFWKKKREE